MGFASVTGDRECSLQLVRIDPAARINRLSRSRCVAVVAASAAAAAAVLVAVDASSAESSLRCAVRRSVLFLAPGDLATTGQNAHLAVAGKRDPGHNLTCLETRDAAFGASTIAGGLVPCTSTAWHGEKELEVRHQYDERMMKACFLRHIKDPCKQKLQEAIRNGVEL